MPKKVDISKNLVSAIDASLVRAEPNQSFLTADKERLSYGALGDDMARLNNVFRQMGLSAGDRVAILSDDDVAVVTIFLALLRAGLTTVIGDGNSTPDELVSLLSAADPAALFADSVLLETARDRVALPNARVVSMQPKGKVESKPDEALLTYPALLAGVEPVTDFPDVSADALALIVFTSGTTSHPKGVSLTHSNLSAQLEIFAEAYGFDERSIILNILPLHHVDGLIRGPLVALRFGGQIYRPMRFSIPRINALLATIPSNGITHFVTVPAMLGLISRLADPGAEIFQGTEFQFVICSADFLESGLWTKFEARFRTMVINAYGLSEVVCDALFSGREKATRAVGTLGKPVGCRARVVNDMGVELKKGEVGELILSGPTIMREYFRQPAETAQVLRDGWLYTGDLVSCDRHGFFKFEGRKKTVVISGGTTIHPENITTAILAMPGIVDAVTFGVSDPVWGQRLVACVVVEPGSIVDTADITHYCREHLAPEKVPAEVHFFDELSRGPAGKVIVERVREMMTNKAPAIKSGKDVYAIASECFKIPVEKLSAESTPYNTDGWDSLAHLAFITRLEEVFGVTLTVSEIIELSSLADAELIVSRAQDSKQ